MAVDPTILSGLFTQVEHEMERAHKKHGANSMLSTKSPGDRLAILVEEVGEVARALTYDEGDSEDLLTELVQTAAMALSWLHALTAEGAGPRLCPSCSRNLKEVEPSVAEGRDARGSNWIQVVCHCGHILYREGVVPVKEWGA